MLFISRLVVRDDRKKDLEDFGLANGTLEDDRCIQYFGCGDV